MSRQPTIMHLNYAFPLVGGLATGIVMAFLIWHLV
jgi:hypothetical protein